MLTNFLDHKLGKKYNMFDLLVLFLIIAMTLMLRLWFIDLQFPDYTICLKPWVEQFRSYGGFAGLKYNIGNYTPAYMHLLMLISYFDVEPLYVIKGVGICLDYVLAIVAAKLIAPEDSKYKQVLLFCAVLLLPTVIANSGVWGQCDNIYTIFILTALYIAMKQKTLALHFGGKKAKEAAAPFVIRTDTLVLFCIGCAFSFKLQTVFILPVLAVIFLWNNYRLRTLLWIPGVYCITLIPSLIAGRPLKELLLLYVSQAGTHAELQLKYPNIYSFWQFDALADRFGQFCIVFCAASLVLFVYYFYHKKLELTREFLCCFTAFSVLYITFFLPHMHDRYAYIAEIVMLFYLFRPRKLWRPVVAQLLALATYGETLFWFSYDGMEQPAALVRLFLLLVLGIDLLQQTKGVQMKQDLL